MDISTDLLRLCAWLVLLAVIFVPLERLWPLHPRKVIRESFLTDLGYYFLSGFAPKILLFLPLTFLALCIHRFLAGGFYPWMSALPMGLRLAAAMVAGEIGSYWGHRWSHE